MNRSALGQSNLQAFIQQFYALTHHQRTQFEFVGKTRDRIYGSATFEEFLKSWLGLSVGGMELVSEHVEES